MPKGTSREDIGKRVASFRPLRCHIVFCSATARRTGREQLSVACKCLLQCVTRSSWQIRPQTDRVELNPTFHSTLKWWSNFAAHVVEERLDLNLFCMDFFKIGHGKGQLNAVKIQKNRNRTASNRTRCNLVEGDNSLITRAMRQY